MTYTSHFYWREPEADLAWVKKSRSDFFNPSKSAVLAYASHMWLKWPWWNSCWIEIEIRYKNYRWWTQAMFEELAILKFKLNIHIKCQDWIYKIKAFERKWQDWIFKNKAILRENGKIEFLKIRIFFEKMARLIFSK